MGRKLKYRYAIARAFVAKSVYNYGTTRALIEALNTMPNLRRICGFGGINFTVTHEGSSLDGKPLSVIKKKGRFPSEATFSRAFSEFAGSRLGDRVHEALVREHLSEELIGHISRDSTAIEGNERPAEKPPKVIEANKEGRKKYIIHNEGEDPHGVFAPGAYRGSTSYIFLISRAHADLHCF